MVYLIRMMILLPPFRGLPAREEDPGSAQDSLERLHLWFSLGVIWVLPEELDSVAGDRDI